MGGWRYLVFWLSLSLLCGVWLIQKTINDRKVLIVWQDTNKKLDRVIELLEMEK
jgi:hypothetical protein